MNISIKDFAKKHNISYEAVRKQLKRYSEELNGHILSEGRTQILDDFAQEFLETKRKTNPIVIYDIEKDDLIEQLKAEKEALYIKLLEKTAEVDELKNEKFNYIEKKLALEYKEKEVKQLENQLEEIKKDKEELKKELTEIKSRSLFNIFKKRR